jgi:hypothetical protein
MKLALLLLLALPLPVVAQSSTFSPRPTTSQSNFNYRVQQQQRSAPERNFQQRLLDRQLQHTSDYRRANPQQQQAMLQQAATQEQLELRRQSATTTAAAQQRQTEAEQQADAKHTRLFESQKRKRQDSPIADEQQAAVQLQKHTQQLTQVLVENYRDVYLPGRITSALRARVLSAKAQQHWAVATKALQSKTEWSQQSAAAATHSQVLTMLTSELLGYDITTAPPATAPVPTGSFEGPMARGYFDQPVADQLLLSANQADKLAASGQLVAALRALNALVAKLPTTPSNADDQKARQKELAQSARGVDKEMQRYNAQVLTATNLLQVQRSILQATTDYLITAGGS